MGSHAGGNKGSFKAGGTPWNKGMKGLQIGGKDTRFKPGNITWNAKYDGYIGLKYDKRGVPYQTIRVALKKYKILARYNYEQAFGEIPPAHVIRFKDGNTLNCAPENLECISRKLNMLINSKHGYSREEAEVREIICLINNEIKGEK